MHRTLFTRWIAALAVGATLALPACSTGGDEPGDGPAMSGTEQTTTAADAGSTDADSTDAGSTGSDSTGAGSTGDTAGAVPVAETSTDTGMLDSTTVHSISVELDEDEYDAMIATYESTGDKEWITATVTIDGVTYEQVGMRLKGNSSLRNVSGSTPENLPWLIKFDKFVDGQTYGDMEELVIRSNGSTTALNEAVALDLLEAGGLASQDAMSTGFSVNGSAAVLRLAIENPDDEWVDTWFGTDGSLYKAEAGGDYSYRGDDAASYDEVFDLEAGDDETLGHLTDFLQFVNESDDATFEAELGEHLDVEAFATYLAMMNLLGNSDDIDGPGNNSYLYYDPDTGLMTVVPWDMNLALGIGMGGGGRDGGGGMPAGGNGGGEAPAGGVGNGGGGMPTDGGMPAGGGRGDGGGFGGRSNVLVERFLATDSFAALYDEALTRLQSELFDSGVADEVLARWVAALESGATDLVDTATIQSEAAQVSSAFPD